MVNCFSPDSNWYLLENRTAVVQAESGAKPFNHLRNFQKRKPYLGYTWIKIEIMPEPK